jgi:hypothetical protein
MEIAEKIVERLPWFYRARERDSYFYSLAEGFAKILRQQEQDIEMVKESHWLESAHGINLDLLSSILGLGRKSRETDDEYRSRIKYTLANLRKGGTLEAVKTQLAAYLGVQKDDVVLVENPPAEMQLEKQVVSGDRWNMSSSSIDDEKATVVISMEGGEAKEPTIANLDFDMRIKYKGTMKKGEVLEIREGTAKLDGVDATASISFERGVKSPGTEAGNTDMPRIPRKPSEWVFREGLTDTLARFDQSKFDENIFYKPVPPAKITFRWTAKLLAAFEVKVSSKVLEKSNMTKQELETLVNAIKAVGIRSIVTIMPDIEEISVVERAPESSRPSRGPGRRLGRRESET